MILYLDTSAFLKLYLDEEGSPAIRKQVADAAGVCTHLITYAEMCAALAQAVRMGRVTEAERVVHKARFEADWKATHVVLVDRTLVHRAGVLAEKLALRGFDSIQLAAAERVWRQVGSGFQLAAFDNRLVGAAAALGIAVCGDELR